MSTLLLLLMTLILQSDTEFPHPEYVVKCYPEMIMPGDSLYFTIVAKNSHVDSIYIMDHFYLFTNDIQIRLRDSDNQTLRLLFAGPPIEADFFLRVAEVKSGDTRVIAVATINVPPLEDLKEPFWEKQLQNLSESEVALFLCITIASIVATDETPKYDKRKLLTFETPLMMKPRPEKEMTLIRKWYDETPKELFPVPYRGKEPTRKVPSGGRSHFPVIENIIVKGEKVTQLQFMRSDNRYPGHPNAPETWQGWKELEESLTPSTMRDEIRLARILIQYSDTEDDTLIKELKDWFTDMNEVQRSVLVKRTRNKGKMYDAVKKFDTALLEWEREYLRNLGLIE